MGGTFGYELIDGETFFALTSAIDETESLI
jgi:hypothetical protein